MILERKVVHNIDEYLEFIRYWFGDNWDITNLNRLKQVHGIPSSYTAIVWIERTYDSEAEWGDWYSNTVGIIDRQNLAIKRKRYCKGGEYR